MPEQDGKARQQDKMYVHDPGVSCKLRCWMQISSAPLVSSDGNAVYVGSNTDYLYAFDTAHGSKLWEAETDGNVTLHEL